jgi:hypothetical protein
VDQYEAKNKLTGRDRDCQDKEMARNLLVSCSSCPSCLIIPRIEPLPGIAVLTAITDSILHTLLDRYEQPQRQRVVRVRLDRKRHAAYFNAGDVTARRETNEMLEKLGARDALRLHWRAWEEGNWLEAVDLVPERAASIYELLQRTPRGEQTLALQQLLKAQTPRSPWHARFLTRAAERLRAHRQPTPLVLGDQAFNRDLLLALDAVAQLREPTLERSLSVRLFGDSKRLKSLRRSLLAVLREHDEEAAAFTADDDWALLRAHHLDRVPEYVPLAGPLVLGWQGTRVDLTPFADGLALAATSLYSSRVAACAARHVVTVENATSFNELLAVRPSDMLALYVGGFASPAVVTLLRRTHAATPQASFFHWGDLDAGGLRILAHLRDALGADVMPLAMNVQTIEAHGSYVRRLNEGDRAALARLRTWPTLADCVELIDYLLTRGHKLEQEAVSAGQVLALLKCFAEPQE